MWSIMKETPRFPTCFAPVTSHGPMPSTCDAYGYLLTIDNADENRWADDTADTYSAANGGLD